MDGGIGGWADHRLVGSDPTAMPEVVLIMVAGSEQKK